MVRWLGDTPDDALDRVLLVMVGAFAGLPCPTLRDINAWTGMSPRSASRKIWAYIDGMQRRGLLEVEVDTGARTRGGTRGIRRRVRIPNGEWTGWTNRTPGSCNGN